MIHPALCTSISERGTSKDRGIARVDGGNYNKAMRPELSQKLRALRDSYALEGFRIRGVFGSVAREEDTPASDIDILYRLDPEFHSRYRGLDALARIEEIRNELALRLGRAVDLADEDSLDEVGRRYVIPETVDV